MDGCKQPSMLAKSELLRNESAANAQQEQVAPRVATHTLATNPDYAKLSVMRSGTA